MQVGQRGVERFLAGLRRQRQKAVDDRFGHLPCLTETAHAVEHGQAPMAGRPAVDPDLGRLLPSQKDRLPLAVDEERLS